MNRGLLLGENGDILVSPQKNTAGQIVGGVVIADTFYQQCKLVLLAGKGEFKEVPTLGFGVYRWLRKPTGAKGRQMFVTELRSELSSVGLSAVVKVEGDNILKFSINQKNK